MAPFIWNPPAIYFCQAAVATVERAGPNIELVCDGQSHRHEAG